MIINRQIPRELRKNGIRYLGVFLLIVIGVAVVTAYNCAAISVSVALHEVQDGHRIEDGNFQTAVPLPDGEIERLEDLGFEIETQFYHDYEKDDQTLRLFAVREDINKLYQTDGSTEIKEDEIFLDRRYADANEHPVGSEIRLSDDTYMVKGIGGVPDYVLIISDLASSSSDAEKFGLGFLHADQMEELPDDQVTYNYAFRHQNPGNDEEQQKQLNILRDELKDLKVLTGFLDNDESTRVIGIFSKLDTDKSVSLMLGVVVVFVIAFLFFSLTKTKIIKDCTAIGTLYAQGYTSGEIRSSYIKIPVLLTLCGTLAGYLIGSRLMMQPLIASLYSFYCIPNVQLVTGPVRLLLTVALPTLIVFLINWIGLTRLLNVEPLKLLRRDLNGSKGVAVKLMRFSFLTRFRLRVLLKHITDNLLLTFGIFLSCFLMIMGMGMHDSISHYLEEVKDSIPADYIYLLKQEVEVDERAAEKIKVESFRYPFEKAKTKMPLTIYGLPEQSAYVDAPVSGDGGIVISDAASDKFDWQIGDGIELESADGSETYRLEVSGIHHDPIGLHGFMERAALNDLVEAPAESFNAYFSEKELSIDEQNLAGITTRDDQIKSAEQYYSMTSGSAKMMIVAAIIIAIILMFVIFELTVDKNKTNISMTKILGYTNREINRIYIGGKIIVVLFSLVVSLPLCNLLMGSMWPKLILTFRGFMPFYILPVSMVQVGAIVLLSYLAIRVITSFSLERVELMYVLKDRE